MSTELLRTSAVIRTLGNCGPPEPPWPSAPSSVLSVATGTPPNCCAAPPVRPAAPSACWAGLLGLPVEPPRLLLRLLLEDGIPPVSLSAAVIALTPDEGAISLVGDSAETAPPLVTKICCSNCAISLALP